MVREGKMGGNSLAGVWTIVMENLGYSLQTEECRVNWGLAEGMRGRWNRVEEEGFRRRMSLLTQKWRQISQGGLAFYSGAEKRRTAIACPQALSHKGLLFGISETLGQFRGVPGGKLHEPRSCLYQHHDRCLSFSLPLIIVYKGDY